MSIAFIFNGQGSQYVGMGKDLFDKYDEVKKIYNKTSISDLCFNGPIEILNKTENTQICIFTTSLAIASLLQKDIKPEFVAGLSLGEYSALCFSEMISIDDGMEIVKERGTLMANELFNSNSGMAAVINFNEEKLTSILSKINGVSIANYNSNSQIVITGLNDCLDIACKKIKDEGGRIIPLKVSGAFHSPLLDNASVKLKSILKKYKFNSPKYRVVYNTYGNESDKDVVDILSLQINNPVYFRQSIEYMIENGVDTFIEIGPGKALSSFIKNINNRVRVYSVFDVESYESVKRELIL